MQGYMPLHWITISIAIYLSSPNASKETIRFAILQKKTKKNLQYSTIITINLIESNKNFYG